jgi:hypothetical protein
VLTAKEIYDLPAQYRAERITREIPNYSALNDKPNMERTVALSKSINRWVSDYFAIQISIDNRISTGSVLNKTNLQKAVKDEVDRFYPTAAQEIDKPRISILRPENLFQMAGASKLAVANTVVRNLNGRLGHLWERLANISPYAINPEIEFGLKIQGVDLIALNKASENIEYQQLKTQHNTLTGSQKPRSVSELSIHEHPIFCAAFNNYSHWTFRDNTIPRRSGAEFWNVIGISYGIILDQVYLLIKNLEDDYVKKLNE